MLEVKVSPEEFLYQVYQSESWMPEGNANNDIPAAYIKKGDVRIRVVVDGYEDLDVTAKISFQQRLKLMQTVPAISAKRHY